MNIPQPEEFTIETLTTLEENAIAMDNLPFDKGLIDPVDGLPGGTFRGAIGFIITVLCDVIGLAASGGSYGNTS